MNCSTHKQQLLERTDALMRNYTKLRMNVMGILRNYHGAAQLSRRINNKFQH